MTSKTESNSASISIKPYGEGSDSKKEQVARMFDGISGRYDLLNRLLSMGIDIRWRRVALRMLRERGIPGRVLDVATGTADLALALAADLPEAEVIGVDLSEGMLGVGRQKVERNGLRARVRLEQADAENLPFEDGAFDAVTVAFGVRNFENLDKGLGELQRVLRPGGHLMVLEFSRPTSPLVKGLMNLYSRSLMPALGGWLSKDRAAYAYLPASVQVFPEGDAFEERLQRAGLQPLRQRRLSMGISSVYIARKG
ncbi:MAG: bifunctional demethylmenaquinone methyltransferase/2-methoxy-6-polyprenyl-1,4-benzoquinol methylase UbiE [Bacteroidia bacterium]|jgi:demethylmenaquinone methyltransferase/2-methoxy-6-polyprenyl-1,4-benzoquinol methylase|nr:bifunctional demethylmenaquinone methyltransferase/2-methoxy-6-polyprenyl-1,4-benzoquinol methylase UbiE [Bacteroidia bacterium]